MTNTRYDETVTVTLYRGTSAGYEAVGTLTKPVPARPNRTVRFSFAYTFTAADLAEGNVVFKAPATGYTPSGTAEAAKWRWGPHLLSCTFWRWRGRGELRGTVGAGG